MNKVKKSGRIAELARRRVRALRVERGLTQEGLCGRAGVSADAVSRIESGSRTPTLETLERLAAALGVRVADLVETTEVPEPRYAPSIMKIASALEAYPEEVHRVVGTVVDAVLKAYSDRALLNAAVAAEQGAGYASPVLTIELKSRRVVFRGEVLPSSSQASDGRAFAALVVLSLNAGKPLSAKRLAAAMAGMGISGGGEAADLKRLRERILAPFRKHLVETGKVDADQVASLIAARRGSLRIALEPQEVHVVGTEPRLPGAGPRRGST